MTDDELLTMVQEASFRYYWEAAHPVAGMAIEILPGDQHLVAVGASGFGIMALVVAVERQFVTRDEAVGRMLQILRFLDRADRFHGVWPHFLDGRTGRVVPYFGKYDDGGDLVETAFLMQALLVARQYFDRDSPAEREITTRSHPSGAGSSGAGFARRQRASSCTGTGHRTTASTSPILSSASTRR